MIARVTESRRRQGRPRGEIAPGVNGKLSAEKARAILELDLEGLQRVEIAERLGIHHQTVRNYLRKANRVPRPAAT